MKIKIIKDYNDLQLKRLVTVKNDKELDVTAARGAELVKAGVAVEVETADNTPAAETPEAVKKPTRKKKEASK